MFYATEDDGVSQMLQYSAVVFEVRGYPVTLHDLYYVGAGLLLGVLLSCAVKVLWGWANPPEPPLSENAKALLELLDLPDNWAIHKPPACTGVWIKLIDKDVVLVFTHGFPSIANCIEDVWVNGVSVVSSFTLHEKKRLREKGHPVYLRLQLFKTNYERHAESIKAQEALRENPLTQILSEVKKRRS